MHEGRTFDERNVEFEIGEGAKYDIVNGVEDALIKLKKGETARISIKSKHAWGSKGFEKFGIPPSADIDYEIELKNFEKAKESWELNGTEKIEQSELVKNKGTELFKVCLLFYYFSHLFENEISKKSILRKVNTD